MIAAFLRTPARRIALAIALSVLVHAVILWLPYITLPQARVQLPPLSARLEPLTKPVETIAEKPEHAKRVPANAMTKSDDSASTKPASKTMAAMNRTEQTTATQPFPKHLQLTFTVYKGTGGLMTGEIRQQLDISGGRYTLKSVRQTSGLSSLRNSDRIIQDSRGKIVETGLQPEIFEQQMITRGDTQRLRVTFDRPAGKLHYSNGSESKLSADAQDSLSFLYQLSQLSMHAEFLPMSISDAAQLHQYQIEIGAKEDITTPMGKLRALHLRSMHARGEAYFEIWLGLEYRLLPVKFSQVDSSGSVTEEMVISGIRAKDE